MSTVMLEDHYEMCIRRGIACLRCWTRYGRVRPDIPPDCRRLKHLMGSSANMSSGLFGALAGNLRSCTGGKPFEGSSKPPTQRNGATEAVRAAPECRSPNMDPAPNVSAGCALYAKDTTSEDAERTDNTTGIPRVDEPGRMDTSPSVSTAYNDSATRPRTVGCARVPSTEPEPVFGVPACVDNFNCVAIAEPNVPTRKASCEESPLVSFVPVVSSSTPRIMPNGNESRFIGLRRGNARASNDRELKHFDYPKADRMSSIIEEPEECEEPKGVSFVTRSYAASRPLDCLASTVDSSLVESAALAANKTAPESANRTTETGDFITGVGDTYPHGSDSNDESNPGMTEQTKRSHIYPSTPVETQSALRRLRVNLNSDEKDRHVLELESGTEIKIIVTPPDDEESHLLDGPCATAESHWTYDPDRLFVLVHKPRPIGSSHGAKAFMVLGPQHDGVHTGPVDSRQVLDDSNEWLLKIIKDALERQGRIASQRQPSLVASRPSCAVPPNASRHTNRKEGPIDFTDRSSVIKSSQESLSMPRPLDGFIALTPSATGASVSDSVYGNRPLSERNDADTVQSLAASGDRALASSPDQASFASERLVRALPNRPQALTLDVDECMSMEEWIELMDKGSSVLIQDDAFCTLEGRSVGRIAPTIDSPHVVQSLAVSQDRTLTCSTVQASYTSEHLLPELPTRLQTLVSGLDWRTNMEEWLELMDEGSSVLIQPNAFCSTPEATDEENYQVEDYQAEECQLEEYSIPSSAESSPPTTPICGPFPLPDLACDTSPRSRSSIDFHYGSGQYGVRIAFQFDSGDDCPL